MAVEGEAGLPQNPASGAGEAVRLAVSTAAALARGQLMTLAVKAASLRQLSASMVFACSKVGFPVVNRHLHLDELARLGWTDLQPLAASEEKGKSALEASVAAMVRNRSGVQSLVNRSQKCMRALSVRLSPMSSLGLFQGS